MTMILYINRKLRFLFKQYSIWEPKEVLSIMIQINYIQGCQQQIAKSEENTQGVKGAAQAPLRAQGSWILMIWYALKSISWTLNSTSLVAFKAIQKHFSLTSGFHQPSISRLKFDTCPFQTRFPPFLAG